MAQTVLTVALRINLDLLHKRQSQRTQIQERIEALLARRAHQAAKLTAFSIRSLAPVDSGALRDSITIRRIDSDKFIGYRVLLPKEDFGEDFNYYPAYLEYGWRYKPEGVPFFWDGIDAVRGTVRNMLMMTRGEVVRLLNE